MSNQSHLYTKSRMDQAGRAMKIAWYNATPKLREIMRDNYFEIFDELCRTIEVLKVDYSVVENIESSINRENLEKDLLHIYNLAETLRIKI